MQFKVGEEVVCISVAHIIGQSRNWALKDGLKEGAVYKVKDDNGYGVILEGFDYRHSHSMFKLHQPTAHLSQQGAQC